MKTYLKVKKKKKCVCLEQNVRNRIWTTDYKLVDISYFIPSAQRTVQISKKKKQTKGLQKPTWYFSGEFLLKCLDMDMFAMSHNL